MSHTNLVVLTGAGISAESGVPTFRASDGLWCGRRVEDVATPEGYAADPARAEFEAALGCAVQDEMALYQAEQDASLAEALNAVGRRPATAGIV